MSTLSISPAFRSTAITRPALVRPSAVRPAETRAVRLTRRGRAVFLLAFLACAFAVMIALGGWATATRDAGAPTPVRVVVVQPGDTLYGIAGKLAAPGKIRDMVHEIQQLNALPGVDLQVGQKIALPVK